jgi:tRNA/tmRNA/rRNA uracil-C5-methylase (TrmA/RlmC/RlmD family)
MYLLNGCIESCRGCSHREKSPEESLQQKTDWLKRKLSPWKEFFSPIVHLPFDKQFSYRDKVCLSAQWNGQRWIFGMKRKDEIIPVPDCPVHTKRINETQKILQKYLPGADQLQLAYYVQSGAQQILVAKSVADKGLQWGKEFPDELKLAGNEGLWLHLHPSAGRKVFGKTHWQLLWGDQNSRTDEGLFYGPMSFQQLIPTLYQDAIKKVQRHFALTSEDAVIDLYSGIGGTLKTWTDSGADAIGVELNGEAVNCAKMNIPSIPVLRGKCKDRIPQLDDWLQGKENKRLFLFTNPPRTGMEPEVIRWIAESAKPLRMAYLSCSAGTLRCNLDELTAGGFKVVSLTPYDFFPRTHHVECLVLIERD